MQSKRQGLMHTGWLVFGTPSVPHVDVHAAAAMQQLLANTNTSAGHTLLRCLRANTGALVRHYPRHALLVAAAQPAGAPAAGATTGHHHTWHHLQRIPLRNWLATFTQVVPEAGIALHIPHTTL
jgi:hypothetical protein